ncbi:hypothetical protein [Pseudorhizobium pelagicum]|mgnify:FL=1|uniref:hypothetical protein n=1 Tax=Pseudorhizobium pelagicum TaxID=1509405 RepID=UPI00055A1B07|nr:hypothetical protein [Pseudorhizobium pelagicum]
MDQRQLDLQDFAIATRKATQEAPPGPAKAAPGEASGQANPTLARRTEQEQRQRAEGRAAAQQEVGNSLKRLKRANQRSIKFFVNIALDYDLKERLRRAAADNDVKMTTVVKAALDYYLAENGY